MKIQSIIPTLCIFIQCEESIILCIFVCIFCVSGELFFFFIVGLPLAGRKDSDFAVISRFFFSTERKITEFSQKKYFITPGNPNHSH